MNQLGNTQFLLRLGPAITMILFGVNQFADPRGWTQYVPRWVTEHLAIDAETVIKLHSLVNMILGVLLLSKLKPALITWLTALWWLSIIPFAFMVDWTIGVLDTSSLFGIFALIGLLTK